MPAIPKASRPALAAALAVVLVACGPVPSGDAPVAQADAASRSRVAGGGPLSIAGGAQDLLPRGDPDSATGAPGGYVSLLAGLPGRTVVAPRPGLSQAVRHARRGGGDLAECLRLTGRTADGSDARELPLVHTRVVAQVSGDVARVEVTQLYVNSSSDRLEAVYAFPLPPDAAVTDMMFRIGNRIVASEVKRREEARRKYEAARAQGRTAALTEQERPNLFTQSVANIPPGATVAVLIRYVHEVPYDDGRYLFHFPTTIGPRYIPGTPSGERSGPGWSPDTDRVPDASRVTPPVLPPGAGSTADVDILVRLVPAAAFDDVVAKSHRVVTGIDGDARVVALAEDDRVSNKDFVLSWRSAERDVPGAHALVQHERGEDFLMLFLQPPAEVAPALVRPKELVFLVDKSGSMMGKPLERAKALVERALDALGPDDTFQIVAFDGAAEAMSASPIAGSAENVGRAKEWLARVSGGGGTEMLEGIRAALAPPADPRRLRMIVFCTDGFIGNEAEIIAEVAALRGSARVFGFGIGSSVNRYLVEGVARAGRGASEIVDLNEPPDEAVARLFRRLDRPVLTDLEVAFEGAEVTDLLPARLPDLLAGQPLVVSGRVTGGTPRAVVLRGRVGERPYEARVPVSSASRLDADASSAEQPVAGTVWARRRIDELLAPGPRRPGEDAVEEVVHLGLRFKLVTPYTSFVAVERELLVDPQLPLASVAVPNALPEGVSLEGIFGPPSVEVLPGRVKPGDPELRVDAGGNAAAVRVALPFERTAREATLDEARGDWVLRFLVPPGWPDGSYEARVTIVRADGSTEEQRVPIRVDTTPAALAVIAAPAAAARGEDVRLAFKPALPAARLLELAGRAGGLVDAVKGAMDLKEVLVRAPWGETVRARMGGALGAYEAVLHVPSHAAEGDASFEIVASDAAGNVSRRHLPITILERPRRAGGGLHASLGAAATAALLAAAALAALARRRGRPEPPLGGVLVRAKAHRGGRSLARRPIALAAIASTALGAVLLARLAVRHRDRVRHIAVPVLADPSAPRAAGVALRDAGGCEVREVLRVPGRVTALEEDDDGALWVGTFDAGLFRLAGGELSAAPGLRGRRRFVNALARHDGLVWAATQGGAVAYDGDRLALEVLAGEGVGALVRAGRALYAGTAHGVFRIATARGAQGVEATGPSGEPLRVTALAASATTLWIGTSSGAYSLPLATVEAPLLERTARWHPLVFGDPPADTNVVTALAPLEDGVLAGTDDGGLVRVREGGGVAALRFAEPRANEVNPGAAAAAGGAVLVGTQGGGVLLARVDGAGLAAERVSAAGRAEISAVHASGARILIGTAAGVVAELHCGAGTPRAAPDGPVITASRSVSLRTSGGGAEE